MAFGEWTLVRERMPGDDRRRYLPALGLVPGIAVLPHFETFGHRWVASAVDAAPREDVVLLGVDERTAAIHHQGRWRCLGAGGVTVIAERRATDVRIRRGDRGPSCARSGYPLTMQVSVRLSPGISWMSLSI